MNSVLAAILMFGASVSVQREIETDDTIAGIVAQVAWGAVEDAFSETARPGGLRRLLDGATFTGLEIDGQPRSGFFAWAGAANRVAGYALDRQHGGSVEYRYQLRVKGYAVSRRTKISDGCVTLTTTTGWTERVPITKRIVREVPIRVSFTIRADETDLRQTRIVGSATGSADTREFRCGIVRGIADDRAADELNDGLSEALRTIETTGRGWYAGGARLGPVLDRMRAGIEFGGRLRR